MKSTLADGLHREMNHYEWLELNGERFFKSLGVEWFSGIISAHGDKFYSYKGRFEENGIHFFHGAAICLLSYCRPFSAEVRDTPKGWVHLEDWAVNNYQRFLPHLPPIEG